MELEEFAKARLDEDEAIAKAAGGDEWTHDSDGLSRPGENAFAGSWTDSGLMGFEPEGDHAARHDPARALRDAGADRRLLSELQSAAGNAGGDWSEAEAGYASGLEAGLLLAVKIRAERFSDHPDYDPEWRP